MVERPKGLIRKVRIMRVMFLLILIFQIPLNEAQASCSSISNFPPEHLTAADELYIGRVIYQSTSIFETEDYVSYILKFETSGMTGDGNRIKEAIYNAPKYLDGKRNEIDKEKLYHIGVMTPHTGNRTSILNPFNLLPNEHSLAIYPHIVSVKCAKPYILEDKEWTTAREGLIYRHSNGSRF